MGFLRYFCSNCLRDTGHNALCAVFGITERGAVNDRDGGGAKGPTGAQWVGRNLVGLLNQPGWRREYARSSIQGLYQRFSHAPVCIKG